MYCQIKYRQISICNNEIKSFNFNPVYIYIFIQQILLTLFGELYTLMHLR